jgi:hypothetical protein
MSFKSTKYRRKEKIFLGLPTVCVVVSGVCAASQTFYIVKRAAANYVADCRGARNAAALTTSEGLLSEGTLRVGEAARPVAAQDTGGTL